MRPLVTLLICALVLGSAACGSNLWNNGEDGGGDSDAPEGGADGDVDGDADSDIDGDADGDDEPPPDPEDIDPCDEGDCWPTSASPAPCSYAAVSENFSTGLYNVHQYASIFHAEGATTISLTRTGGEWQPVVIVTELDGRVLHDGLIGLATEPGLSVELLEAGTTGDEAAVAVATDVDVDVLVHVTSWEVVDSGFVDDLPADATYRIRIDNECEHPSELIAPAGALAGETVVDEGSHAIEAGADGWGAALRVDAARSEHIGFAMAYSGASAEMQLLAWDGSEAVALALTSYPSGLRFLAGFDPFGARTFWVRARGAFTSADVEVTRTPFEEGPGCHADCDRFLQLPVPIDPARQGYALRSDVTYAEQFGRRELLMAVFHAGARIVESGLADPFTIQDLSRWDGEVWDEHATHNDGFHADISVYTADGEAVWYSPGADFGDEPMAMLLAGLFESGPFESGNPPQIILDSGYHDDVYAGAETLLADGVIDAATFDLFDPDLGLIYHYVNHHHHIHLRVDR